jgi:hypothetical protein
METIKAILQQIRVQVITNLRTDDKISLIYELMLLAH